MGHGDWRWAVVAGAEAAARRWPLVVAAAGAHRGRGGRARRAWWPRKITPAALSPAVIAVTSASGFRPSEHAAGNRDVRWLGVYLTWP